MISGETLRVSRADHTDTIARIIWLFSAILYGLIYINKRRPPNWYYYISFIKSKIGIK